MENNKLDQKKIIESQGVRLARPDLALKPRNRIEAAITRSSQNKFLPELSPKIEAYKEELPLKEKKIIKENLKSEKKNILYIILSALSLVALSILLYGGYKGVKNIASPTVVQNDIPEIMAAVGRSVELPQGEDPTIMTVTNLAPLKGQEFFNDARIGDKVIIFSKSKKAILYRPSTHNIILIAPLTI